MYIFDKRNYWRVYYLERHRQKRKVKYKLYTGKHFYSFEFDSISPMRSIDKNFLYIYLSFFFFPSSLLERIFNFERRRIKRYLFLDIRSSSNYNENFIIDRRDLV